MNKALLGTDVPIAPFSPTGVTSNTKKRPPNDSGIELMFFEVYPAKSS